MKPEQIADRYAIFQTGGKQYQAVAGKTLAIEKLDAEVGASVTFDHVLLLRSEDGSVELGKPFLSTKLTATIVKHDRGPKIVVFKFRRRKKYKRKLGHRQPMTIVRFDTI